MDAADSETRGNWTVSLRKRLSRTVPPGQLLPDRQPAYVQSWIYVFGVATLAALIYVIASGVLLTVKGTAWWHTSSLGHFINSTHLWSVELFFVFMVVHLWGKFFMAAWRGKRAMTWITGAVAFVGSIATAFTGYLSQSNFDSQWISTQAKDGLNSVSVGAFFNVLNPNQMLMWHVVLLPAVVGILVVLHLLLVRRHGVVPPFDAQPPGAEAPERSHIDGRHVAGQGPSEPETAPTVPEQAPAQVEVTS
jgi:quinol-cytochrome oxidoreductase complex cytochrome b subunit